MHVHDVRNTKMQRNVSLPSSNTKGIFENHINGVIDFLSTISKNTVIKIEKNH
jgi:hypothetical protein